MSWWKLELSSSILVNAPKSYLTSLTSYCDIWNDSHKRKFNSCASLENLSLAANLRVRKPLLPIFVTNFVMVRCRHGKLRHHCQDFAYSMPSRPSVMCQSTRWWTMIHNGRSVTTKATPMTRWAPACWRPPSNKLIKPAPRPTWFQSPTTKTIHTIPTSLLLTGIRSIGGFEFWTYLCFW